MAKGFKKKIHQPKGQAGEFQQEQQEVKGNPSNPDPSIFTPEQRQILGKVYQLILSWRRERMTAGGRTAPISSGGMDGTTIHQAVPAEVEA